MDEESIGFFSVLLIVTAIALTHPFQLNRVVLTLPDIRWQDMVEASACGPDVAAGCTQTPTP
ncbi:MAG TPA: hypothetical protein VGP50_05095 [Stellaceae bacterium]|jgi:hypothetical protein|nr:hypothetical protein [Stellaceae bacterium]